MTNSDFSENTQTPKAPRSTEVERKFRIFNPPYGESLREYEKDRIRQGYIAIEEGGTEVRIRRRTKSSMDESFTLTVKSKGGLARYEDEVDVSHEQFSKLWPATEGRRVEKTRFKIPHEGRLIELDVYEGDLNGLCVAEVEFPDEEAASKFNPPEWFDLEVTEDKAFKNQQLAINGMPA